MNGDVFIYVTGTSRLSFVMCLVTVQLQETAYHDGYSCRYYQLHVWYNLLSLLKSLQTFLFLKKRPK